MNILPKNTNPTIDQVGGKAYHLEKLCEIGCKVPDFFVLSSDIFFEFLGNRLTEYRDILAHYTDDKRTDLIDLLSECEFPDTIRDKIAAEIDENTVVAVRSSATDEDGECYSFAGMMESYLNVQGIDAILHSVKQCYLSCFSQRIMQYRIQNDLITPTISVAVMIQNMVDAEISGVIFTSNPITNEPDEMRISAVAGLGEQLVSGASDSSDYTIDCNGKILERSESSLKLTDETVHALYEAAKKIEYGFQPRRGLDIEYCIKSGEIFILQSRLITPYRHIRKDEFRTVLDNSNIIESYSGVTTPLTFTFAREVYSKIYKQTLRTFYVKEEAIQSIADDLDHMLHFYENKIYYRLNSWYKMTALYPGYEKNKQYMENMMGVKSTLHESQVGAKTRLIRIYASFLWKMLHMKRDSKRFLERFERVTAPYYGKKFDGYSSQDALGVYDTLEREILDDFITPIANDMGAMVIYGKLTEVLKNQGIDGYEGLLSAAISKQGNVESAQQSAALLRITEQIRLDEAMVRLFQSDYDIILQHLDDDTPIFAMIREYIRKYGARTMDELKLETVTLFEDPSFLFDMIRGYLECASLPESGGKDETEADERLLLPFGGMKKIWVKVLLRLTKYFIRNRESLRLRRTYIYSIVRNIYLQIGENLAKEGFLEQPRDIFFLTKDEITRVVSESAIDSTDIRTRISNRKTEYDCNRTKPIYERMYFYGDVCPENMIPIYTRQEVSDHKLLSGVAGGGGVVEGIVRLVEDPADAQISDCILMAKRTDPGWTVLFPMAKAIIIERGSVLSHSAVVAREMGIPLVAGIRGLTDRVRDGMRVRVDGINGTVEIMEEPDA